MISLDSNASPYQTFRMGEGSKKPPTSFSPVTSTKVGSWPQNFMNFSFDPFAILV